MQKSEYILQKRRVWVCGPKVEPFAVAVRDAEDHGKGCQRVNDGVVGVLWLAQVKVPPRDCGDGVGASGKVRREAGEEEGIERC